MLRSVVVTAVAVLALSGCMGGEEPLRDDGTQAVPLAGLRAELEAADVEVVRAEQPAAASADDVVTVLDDAGVRGVDARRAGEVDDGVVGFDPAATAGLVALVRDEAGTAVVAVFGDPSAAAVFAAADPTVFGDEARESDRTTLLSGNVVAYVAGEGTDRVREAVRALADEAPTESPTDSPTDSPS